MDLHARVAQLEAELAALKAALPTKQGLDTRQPTAAPTPRDDTDQPRARGTGATDELADRRGFIRVAAAGAVGLAAGAVAFASPAAAADGQTVLLGSTGDGQNVATSRTRLRYDGTALIDTNAFTFADSDIATSSQPSALAGYASTRAKHGVYGFTSSSDGYGVVAVNGNSGGGSAFFARSVTGVGARLEGGRANLLLPVGPVAGIPPGAHERGELFNDANGDLWFCIASGTPGTWRKLAGSAIAGGFHILATPARIYDSRKDAAGKLAANTERIVSLASTASVAAVPAGAVAAMFNITIVNTVGSGFLTAYSAALATLPPTSNVNWFAKDQTHANLAISAVDQTARIKLYAGVNVTDVIIDVLGFYL
jgi:hypothetical protein